MQCFIKTGVNLQKWCGYLQLIIAFLCFIAGFACLWIAVGLPFKLPSPSIAAADDSIYAQPTTEAEAKVYAYKKDVLQASVNSVALSLGAMLPQISSAKIQQDTMAQIIDEFTSSFNSAVYVTVWEGARLIHAPLAPDAADTNFIHALDSFGHSFIRAINDCLEQGGGFTQVVLPRRIFDSALPDSTINTSITGSNDKFSGTGHLAPDLLISRLSVPVQNIEVPHEVYSCSIPGSSWHISAFANMDALTVDNILNTSARFAVKNPNILPVGVADLQNSTAFRFIPNTFRAGLALSGFSLLGMAGFLVRPRKQR